MSEVFTVNGKKINFSDDKIKYNWIRLEFKNHAERYANGYISDYYEKYGGLDEFSEQGLDGGYRVLLAVLEMAIQKCIDAKIYDIDEDRFLDEYGAECFAPWGEAFDKIDIQYQEIIKTTEELNAYRDERKANRSRIIGGGFGFSGAVKGMAMAGAMNMATGAIHGTFNIIGKGITAVGNSFKKSEIYNSEETKEILWNGIYDAIFNIHTAMCKILKIPMISDNEISKARTLYKNIGRMTPQDAALNMVNILQMDPYEPQYYEYCIKVYGDRTNELQRMALFFGVDLSRYIHNLLKMHENPDLSTEQSALVAKASLQKSLENLGIQTNGLLKEIDNKLRDFDLQARTVEGVTFNTREEASVASIELKKIHSLMNSSNFDSCSEVERMILSLDRPDFSTSIKNKYLQILNEKLHELLTVGGVKYGTAAEADSARIVQENNEIARISQLVNQHDISSAKAVLTVLQKISTNMPETAAAKCKIGELEKLHSNLAERERTKQKRIIGGILFVAYSIMFGALFREPIVDALLSPLLMLSILLALFAIIKPMPATFYTMSSRWKAFSLYAAISIVALTLLMAISPQPNKPAPTATAVSSGAPSGLPKEASNTRKTALSSSLPIATILGNEIIIRQDHSVTAAESGYLNRGEQVNILDKWTSSTSNEGTINREGLSLTHNGQRYNLQKGQSVSIESKSRSTYNISLKIGMETVRVDNVSREFIDTLSGTQWVQIKTGDNRTGWVLAKFVSLSELNTKGPNDQNREPAAIQSVITIPTTRNAAFTGQIVNGQNGVVNLYASPSSDAPIVGSVSEKRNFPCNYMQGDFYFYPFDSKGWVRKENVKALRAD